MLATLGHASRIRASAICGGMTPVTGKSRGSGIVLVYRAAPRLPRVVSRDAESAERSVGSASRLTYSQQDLARAPRLLGGADRIAHLGERKSLPDRRRQHPGPQHADQPA